MATEQQIRKLAAVIVEHSGVFELLSKEAAQWAIQNPTLAMSSIVNNLESAVTTVKKPSETIIQKVTNLLRLVKETSVSDTAAKKLSESFVGSRYYHRDSDLDGLLSAQQEAGAAGKVSVYQLEREMAFKGVAQALLGVDEASIDDLAKGLIAGGHTVVPSQIEALIERTEQGEDTGLITDGYGNFFFVQDKKGSVSGVVVYRDDDGPWNVRVYRLDYGRRWRVEDRFFSRN
jgi:hypothetical protein